MIQITDYGPWAVVTGASSGIGRAFAEQLAAAGLNVVLAARRTALLQELGEDLATRHGVAYRVVTADLATPEGPRLVVEVTEDVDVGLLVSNAGAGRPGAFLEQDLDDLHRRHTLNATAHLDLVHAFGRRFTGRARSGIVVVSALGAVPGIPNMAHEAASKAYVHSLGVALHHELATDGVQVMVLVPGNVDTEIIDSFALDRSALPIRPQPADRAVRGALRAFLRGREQHIPGTGVRVMTRLTPRSLQLRMNGRMLGRAAQNLDRRERTAAEQGA